MSKARIFWFTGLSGSGKTTIATGLAEFLERRGKKVLLLDGDKIRVKINRHLGFSREDILLNNSSVIQMCKDGLLDYDYILVAVISPFSQSREKAREVLGKYFYEIYVKASLETLIQRDTKGFYQRALNGEIENFIGIDKNIPYVPPSKPEVIIDTEKQGPRDSIEQLIKFILQEESALKAV